MPITEVQATDERCRVKTMMKQTVIHIVCMLLLAGCATTRMSGKVPIPAQVRMRLILDYHKEEFATVVPRAEYDRLKAGNATTGEVHDSEYIYYLKKELSSGDGPDGKWSGVKLKGVFRTSDK